MLVALLALPYSPGLDDPALYTSIYSYQHYGQLSFPDDDIPFMYKHPPTKYWAVGLLVSAGLPLRLATAGLFLASYLLVLAAATACRFTFFQHLAVLFAVPATVTLCPFISYSPENLAHGEAIGRLRPDDLVLTFWLSGLLWLEAARRERQRLWYGVAGGACIGLASVTHWFGIPALAAIVVYLAAARLGRDPEPGRRSVLIGLGAALVLLPFWIVIRPYWPQVWALISSQGGEPSPAGLAAAWTRHSTDFWFLFEWMKMHASEVWAAAALLSVPVTLAIPPILIAAPILLALPATRVFGLAAIWLPFAVLRANHKSIGYELPELALYLLAIGWLVALPMETITNPRIRVLSASVFLLPTLTSSPALWHPQVLRLMDQSHSLDLLRSVGRALVGPGATVVGRFYTSGADNWLASGLAEDPGVDFVATREFDLHSAPLHRSYRGGPDPSHWLRPDTRDAERFSRLLPRQTESGAGYGLRPASADKSPGSLQRRLAGRSPCSVARRTKRSCPGCSQRRLVRSRVTSRARSTAWPKRSRRPGQIPRLPCCSDAHVPSETSPTRCSSRSCGRQRSTMRSVSRWRRVVPA